MQYNRRINDDFPSQFYIVHHEEIEASSETNIKVNDVSCFQWYGIILDEIQMQQTSLCPNLHSKFNSLSKIYQWETWILGMKIKSVL